MPINELLTTAVACRVCRIDRQRFNEHVASGAYFFAPDAAKGRSRYFGDADLVALYIFARQVERQVNSKAAGQLANYVFDAINYDRAEGEKQIAVCYSLNGGTYVKKGSELPPLQETMRPAPYEIQIFDLENIRSELAHGISYERRILHDREDD